MKTIHFLSGLPRSGSTLLAAILNQNPALAVTMTSPVLELMFMTNSALNKLSEFYSYSRLYDKDIYRGMIDGFYSRYKEDIIIDKQRAWPKNIEAIKETISPDPRIIVTLRSISEVITSYLMLIEKQTGNNFIDNKLREYNLPFTTAERAKLLWEGYISDPHFSIMAGLKEDQKHFYYISYDEIVNSDEAISKIYDFLCLDKFEHKKTNIKSRWLEKDELWGLSGLHKIRPIINKISVPPENVLGQDLKEYYDQFNIVP